MSFQDVQIAFAGHNRPEDLDDSTAARASLDHALRLLAAAGVTSGRLITGVADGADLLAVAAWNATGLGPTHAVYPFLREPAAEFPADRGRAETWLDGEGFEAGGRSAYLAQSRWLVESADILLAVWGGDAARGPGGTADAVRLAMERGIAILWIQPPDYEGLKLITPPDVDDFFSFNELLQQIERGVDYITAEATAERVAAALDRQGLGRHAEAEVSASPPRRLLGGLDDLAHATLWKTYALFHRVAGGARAKAEAAPEVPPDLAAQPGFVRLTAACTEADRLANRLAAVYRTQQLYLLTGAVVATLVGTSPAIWPDWHLPAVLAELWVALIALLVWSSAARARRHERWSDARRLAEQLRLERAAWALGVTAIDPQGSDTLGPAACRARACRRQAGLAVGRFDGDRVRLWGDWAIGELVISQANYHRDQGERNHRIAHRMHGLENLVFVAFVTILLTYVGGSALCLWLDREMPEWVGGVLILTSAVVPAVGAAVLALETQLAFSERSRESAFLAARLDRIRSRMPAAPRLHDYQRAASAAIRLHNTEQDQWAENAARRPLIKGA